MTARLITLSHKIGNIIDNVSWRIFWQVKVHNFFYSQMTNPWFDGQKWVERES